MGLRCPSVPAFDSLNKEGPRSLCGIRSRARPAQWLAWLSFSQTTAEALTQHASASLTCYLPSGIREWQFTHRESKHKPSRRVQDIAYPTRTIFAPVFVSRASYETFWLTSSDAGPPCSCGLSGVTHRCASVCTPSLLTYCIGCLLVSEDIA